MAKFDYHTDVIDSRDILAKIEELEDGLESLKDDDGDIIKQDNMSLELEDIFEEWEELKKLSNECAQYSSDWEYGETLIRKSYFTEYCKDMVADIGDLPSDIPDYLVIDWKATAENLKEDYTEVEYCGASYYVRNS